MKYWRKHIKTSTVIMLRNCVLFKKQHEGGGVLLFLRASLILMFSVFILFLFRRLLDYTVLNCKSLLEV